MQKDKNLSVTIPAGVDDGDKVRLSGEGNAVAGGANGDLYVLVNLLPNKLFERNGKDLYFETPIPFDVAVLGGSINIPTLESKISLKIPPSTQTGKVFRIAGKGASSVRDSRRGDLLCRVVVETPINLSKKQKDLIRELSSNFSSNENYPIDQSFKKASEDFLKD
jgi:molecular chaperone DnaJ